MSGPFFIASRKPLSQAGMNSRGIEPPDDVVLELVAGRVLGGQRLDVARHLAVLAGAAGLLLVRVAELRVQSDRLAVGDLRLARDHLAGVLALHALDVDLEVQLAHAADDGLGRLLVAVDAEGRVLLGEAVERLGEVGRVLLVLRRDGQRDDGLGHVHRGHRVVDRPSVNVSPDEHSTPNSATMSPAVVVSMSFISFECMRTRRGTLTRLRLLRVVDDEVALGERPLVDAHVRELPVAPVLELERQADERLLRIGLEDDLLLVLVLIERDVGDLLRIREVRGRRRRAGAGRPCSCRRSRMNTGVILSAMVTRRIAACSSSMIGSCSARNLSAMASS